MQQADPVDRSVERERLRERKRTRKLKQKDLRREVGFIGGVLGMGLLTAIYSIFGSIR
jgi:hypothetical protein